MKKGKKGKGQTEQKNYFKKILESVKHGGKFIMVQSSSNMEKKKWQTGQKISGKVSNTVENIWSKILFDLKKAVFACETPAFSQKS